MSLSKDQIALDAKKKKEKMGERMTYVQDGIRELQEKAQVRIVPVLKTGPQSIQANIELIPESEKTLEQCLTDYTIKQSEPKKK